MPNPFDLGKPGGQQYDVASAIRSFLGQLAEYGINLGAAVIKELLQNADDAGATELSVILDERQAPSEFVSQGLEPLVAPALIVRNNARFKTTEEVAPGESDDFTAIRNVAKEHKLSQVTAAGRFGMGFNSVYFLTNIPLLFSRREVNLFDLLHLVVGEPHNGWQFPLEQFPSSAGGGTIKGVLERAFPKSVLQNRFSFGEIAHEREDYLQAIFRLPLRRSQEGHKPLFQSSFPTEQHRLQLLEDMWRQASRSLLFLKTVRKVTFAVIRSSECDEWGVIEASEQPDEFQQFVERIKNQATSFERTAQPDALAFYRRTISHRKAGGPQVTWSFLVKHMSLFHISEIATARERLHKNKERAVPWVALALPSDLQSMQFDGGATAWRVYLPLMEAGPSNAIFHASLFVGPSRQKIEFRTNESDESLRKTDWNKLLVKYGLAELLRDADLSSLIPELFLSNPKEALSLIPTAPANIAGDLSSLAEYFQEAFHQQTWQLRLSDLWGQSFEILVGDPDSSMQIEMVPDWLAEYRTRFEELSSDERRFVARKLGEALSERLPKGSIRLQWDVDPDVPRLVLSAEETVKLSHLQPLLTLLKKLPESERSAEHLQGLWAFQSSTGQILRFEHNALYLIERNQTEGIHGTLRRKLTSGWSGQ